MRDATTSDKDITAGTVPLEFRSDRDCWTGSWRGQSFDISPGHFARRLNDLAVRWFHAPWDELGEEEYIHVLVATRHDLAFWAAVGGSGAPVPAGN